MKVAVTGTPGTGKTTVSEPLGEELGLEVIHLGGVIRQEGLYTEIDEERDSVVADIEAVEEWLEGRDDVVVEDHLSHLFDVDFVIVLRCRPDVLEQRLSDRGYDERKVRENVESETLDVVLAEALELHPKEVIYETDTTEKGVDETVEECVEAIRNGKSRTRVVDWSDFIGV